MSSQAKIFTRIAMCILGYSLCLTVLAICASKDHMTAVAALCCLLFLFSWRQEGVIRREIAKAEQAKWSVDTWE